MLVVATIVAPCVAMRTLVVESTGGPAWNPHNSYTVPAPRSPLDALEFLSDGLGRSQ